MAYNAIVARIITQPIPGCDRILMGTCCGYNVIVGGDTKDGDLGIFFEAGGQLSEGFVDANDLVRRKTADGEPAGGYFEPNRRVKAIKMRGVRSEGFWIPLESVAYTGVSLADLTEGTQFTALNGRDICCRYETPAQRRFRQRGGTVARQSTPMFRKHVETEQWKRAAHLIPTPAMLYVTEKLHGTSQRIGHVLDDVPIQRGRLGRLWAKWRKLPDVRRGWTVLHGSRNVILERRSGDGFYGKELFRYTATHAIKERLHKGEVVYGEIVGYTETGASIMASQDTTGLKDKAIEAQFGKSMTYAYGCRPGECRFYVYRITQVNEDGVAFDLSWPQVAARCRDLGVPPVPTLGVLFAAPEESVDSMAKLIAMDVEQEDGQPLPSTVDPSHIREGVVIRYESMSGEIGWLKWKSYAFGVLEGYLRERDDFVDTEEVS